MSRSVAVLIAVATTALASAIPVQAQTIIHVDDDAPPGGDGTTWPTAYKYLQDALAVAVAGDEIHVAGGTYTPDQDEAGNVTLGDRTAAFQLISGVVIRGGYRGCPVGDCDSGDPEERHIELYKSILSGDLNGNDNPADFPVGPTYAENCYHVFYHPAPLNLDHSAVLDGFTITSGNANSMESTWDKWGGGMFNEQSSPALINCTFRRNVGKFGGGMYNLDQSSPRLIGCGFSGNFSFHEGGGMYDSFGSDPVLTNCVFNGNAASTWGGAIYGLNSNATLLNCTLSGNSAALGAGLYSDGGLATLTNSVLWGNQPDEIYAPTTPATVTYSFVQGGAGQPWFGEGCIDGDPLLVDADGPDNIFGTDDDDLRLLSGSPCIDAGNNAAVPPDPLDLDGDGDTAEPLPFDLNGHPRFMDDLDTSDSGIGTAPIVDMGPYEYSVDCNGNGTPDVVDIEDGTSADCNANGVPDECEPGGLEDCNQNSVPDLCDLHAGTSGDCNENAIPDECEALVLYVDDDAPDGGNGLGWDTAFHHLQDALALTDCTLTEIRVAEGTYHPDESTANPEGTGDREATFQLINGVAIRGGYRGCPEGDCESGDPDERDIELYESILNGDLAGDDVEVTSPEDLLNEPTRFDNAYHVATATGTDETAMLDGFTITGGNADGAPWHSSGGGMWIEYGSPKVANCDFRANSAASGGAICNMGGSPTMANCTFSRNSAGHEGGGMYNYYGTPTLTDCMFSDNSAPDGGGIRNEQTEATLTNCTFRGNSSYMGGGMHNRYSSPALINCAFLGNSATAHGGGICNIYSNHTLINCTFSGNLAEQDGGAMYNYGGDPTIANCILWGDLPNEISGDTTEMPLATYSNIQGGTVQAWFGEGCINVEPLFVDPGYWDDNDTPADPTDDFWVDGDLRLQTGSPCIDAGDNDAPGLDGVSTDLDGNPRRVDDPDAPDTGNPGAAGPPIVDMGVYEYWPDCNSNDIPDYADIAEGSSDDCNINGKPDECEPGGLEDCNTNGMPDLCDIFHETSHDCNTNAIPDECDIAGETSDDRDGDDIPDDCEPVHNITQDTIHPAIQEAIDLAVDGDEIEVGPWTFVERINLLGKPLTLRSTDGPEVTIIDGDAVGSVITCTSGEGPDTVIEGFTVANGDAVNGGGMYNSNSSPTVINCVFSGNSAAGPYPDGLGGGMYNHQASPTLTNCTFSGNTATDERTNGSGGGMYNHEGSPTLIDCNFTGNSAHFGGGMYNFHSSSTLNNCTFSENSATDWGGGAYNDQSSPMLTDCAFSGNSGSYGGGIVSIGNSSPTLTNCTFSGNSATDWGGGMANWSTSSPTVINCTFSQNSALVGGGMLNGNSSCPAVTNCTFSGNSAASGGGMCNIEQSDPTLTNCIFSGNSAAGTAPNDFGGGVYNWDSSPTLANCTFSGNSAVTGCGIYNDTARYGSSPAVTNCILWGSTTPTGQQIHDVPGSTTTVTYSCVQDDEPGDGSVCPGTGNIDGDPLFAGPGDLHLTVGSPCIDAGDPAFLPDPGETDLDGHTRVLCGQVDMGAYEFGIGDYECDDDMDLDDFVNWEPCMTGPEAGPYDPGCEAFDFEYDLDVDLRDFAGFQSAIYPATASRP